MSRFRRQLYLTVDNETTTLEIDPSLSALNIPVTGKPLFIAGNDSPSLRSENTAFVGTLHGLRLSGRRMLLDAQAEVVGMEYK